LTAELEQFVEGVKRILVDPKEIGQLVAENLVWAIIATAAFVLLPRLIHTSWRLAKARRLVDRQRDLSERIDHRLARTSYLWLEPPIDLLDPEHQRVSLSVSPETFKISPPATSEGILEATQIEGISSDDPRYALISENYRKRVAANEFSDRHRFVARESQEFRAFGRLVKSPAFEDARRRVFCDFLREREGFHFNGRKFAVERMMIGRDHHEQPTVVVDLQPTDYFTYSVLTRLAGAVIPAIADDWPAPGPHLSEYLARGIQRNIHASFGVCVVVHTIRDQRLIVTQRSAHSANRGGEVGKLFHSACEGVNEADLDSNVRTRFRPLRAIVERALEEEVFGPQDGKPSVSSLIVSCKLAGLLLYFPHLSLNLSVYTALDCDSAEVRRRYRRARDGGFETAGILFDEALDERTGLPEASIDGIRDLVKRTLRADPEQSWDEGALVSLLLCSQLLTRRGVPQ